LNFLNVNVETGNYVTLIAKKQCERQSYVTHTDDANTWPGAAESSLLTLDE